MYDGRRDYLRRRRDRRMSRDRRGPMRPEHSGSYMSSDYASYSGISSDYARQRYDAAMDRARRRRGRSSRTDRSAGYSDSSYSVGHYLYQDPAHSQYVPVMDYSSHDKEYEEDLHEWISRLKHHDKFKLDKHEIIRIAKEMNIDFNEFSEDELYAAYLLHVKLYPDVHHEPHMYVACAKAWLCEKDIAIDPSEKICKYLYEIVLDD